MEHAFVAREVFFRSGDRFHHFRVSVRAQKIAAVAAVAVIGWGFYATASYGVQKFMLAGKEKEITEHKLAYIDLLAEVGEYHTQFSRITKDLEENQAYLLSLIEQTPRNRNNLAAIQGRLKNSEAEHARVMIAREGLRARMEQFESELLEIAGKNLSLQSQVAQMQDLLDSSRAERDEVAAVREQLVRKLSEMESRLTKMAAAKQKLMYTVDSLQQELDTAEGARQGLANEKSRLNERLAGLKEEIDKARAQQGELQDRVAGLNTSLAQATDRGQALEEQRNVLKRRVVGLEQHLVDLRDAEQGVIERLSERTKLSVEVIEKTVAMTGLDVNGLIEQISPTGLGQGGPFIPAVDEAAVFEPGTQMASTVTLLDEQLDRWSALHEVIGSLPLTAPLAQYRISSGYGERRDPVNGRKARHQGVDFAAATRSRVYATAPGKVVFAGWRGRYGRSIEIDHGHGIRTRYGHLRKILVKIGEEVDHHQKIGLLGSSGRSTGPHVHYEIRYKGQARNPMKFLKAGRYVFKG